MASFTVRNIPEDAKQRFRQIAAAHGRSMEEHLRQMIVDAKPSSESTFQGVRDVAQNFRHEPAALTRQSEVARDSDHAARIRAMSSAEFIRHLIETAGGVGLDLPPRSNIPLDREVFGAD